MEQIDGPFRLIGQSTKWLTCGVGNRQPDLGEPFVGSCWLGRA
jgi:hypothetical protein